jgi:electron transport complex protein RnfB
MGSGTLFLLIIIIGSVLAWLYIARVTSRKPEVRNSNLVYKIDSLLPQTQCGDCGYAGCLPYAQAIVSNEADINQCHPGGEKTVELIAELLARDRKVLSNEHAIHQQGMVAIIDENECIGCVKCIKACPVDAIIGAAKQMHTVLPRSCTGCSLCIDPCPVDCISMVPAQIRIKEWIWTKPVPDYEVPQ